MNDHVRAVGTRQRDFFGCRFFAVFVAIAAFAQLTGCALLQNAPPGAEPATGTAIPPAAFFTLQGRISVRVADKLETAKILWTRLPAEERVELFTPFGNQIAELVRLKDGRVNLRRGRETETAASMAEISSALLGVPLDLDAVALWTQGIGFIEDVPTERSFAQSNGDSWQVTVERLQTRGAYRIASRVLAIRGDTVVRLVIDEWRAE